MNPNDLLGPFLFSPSHKLLGKNLIQSIRLLQEGPGTQTPAPSVSIEAHLVLFANSAKTKIQFCFFVQQQKPQASVALTPPLLDQTTTQPLTVAPQELFRPRQHERTQQVGLTDVHET